jgi:hypothetical protein
MQIAIVRTCVSCALKPVIKYNLCLGNNVHMALTIYPNPILELSTNFITVPTRPLHYERCRGHPNKYKSKYGARLRGQVPAQANRST